MNHERPVFTTLRRGRHNKHKKLIFKEKSYALQGAIFDVYKKMGVDLTLALLVNFSSYLQIKKILKIDYPRGRAKEYFANFISIQ